MQLDATREDGATSLTATMVFPRGVAEVETCIPAFIGFRSNEARVFTPVVESHGRSDGLLADAWGMLDAVFLVRGGAGWIAGAIAPDGDGTMEVMAAACDATPTAFSCLGWMVSAGETVPEANFRLKFR